MNQRTRNPMHILVVDDEKVVRDSLAQWLKEDGYDVAAAADAREALLMVKERPWDLALIDIKMPGMDGLELQHRLRDASPATAVIIMTAFASVDTAVEALKVGAYDYITKPFDPDHLNHLLSNIAERQHLTQENRKLREQMSSVIEAEPILGTSPNITRALDLIRTVAPTDTSVLITGESGTGKELVARAIHAGSPRAFMPLVIVNCGALPEGTLESELFGHERGAFTGAHYRHKGKFELADGGTLFLDEIGEVSARIQVELLRVLEEKRVVRLGDTKPVQADFRLIVATNKDLDALVRAGTFREDLYYRINVFHIPLPPLRERKEDIPLLARALVKRLAHSMNTPVPEITPEAMARLEEYEWPGNVRELANALERAMVVSRNGDRRIRPQHLPIRAETPVRANGSTLRSLADVERDHIEKILRETEWNISRTAQILGVDRSTVYNKMRLFDLKR